MGQKDREEIALFRMSLIGDLVIPGLTVKERSALLREKSSRTYRIPGTLRTRIAESTFRDWIRLYKLGGLDALKPPFRCDSGRCRSLPAELVDRILQLREEDPSRSVHTMLRMLQLSGELGMEKLPPASSVYRLLESRGLSKRRPAPTKAKDRRPFAFEHRNQCWQSDVMCGPLLPGPGGKNRKTYLISLMDDATRLIVHCQFCWSEKLSDFLPVLRQALLRRGVPERLFADNGAAYISTHLAVICASLNVALRHARPYSPESKGKIERWHRTVRQQFLAALDFDQIHSLEDLNRRMAGWVEGEYHQTPHQGLKRDGYPDMTPLDRWMLHEHPPLRFAPEPIDEFFLIRYQRTVYSDRTIRLLGRIFEAPAEFIGRKVELRCDPSVNPPTQAFLYVNGQRHGQLRTVDLVANTRIWRGSESEDEPEMPVPKPSSGLNYIELTCQAQEARNRRLTRTNTTPDGGEPC